MIGRTLAHFEISAKLGEGGMGEVYRATDSRLGREVAVKVLPEAFTRDAERLARFEREARVLAALNHAHIAGIYEVGQADGSHFLAMELVEGEDLSERLARGPLPRREALGLALQIARALEAAHARGIVHRDLKPANVMITPRGEVKILDFGLAKAWLDSTGPAADLSHSPTLTAQHTVAGTLLGTAAYMAPEQARGAEADQRSDLWALGALLYEMLAGRRLFDEPSVTETLAVVLKGEIALDDLPADLSPATRRVLERCLERDADRRYHAAADVRIELEDALAGRDAPSAAAEAGRAPIALRRLALVAAGLAAGALSAWLALGSGDLVAIPRQGAPQHREELEIVLGFFDLLERRAPRAEGGTP